MKVLITGGSTQTMIDKVRCISNIFKGSTANHICKYFWSKLSGSSDIYGRILLEGNDIHILGNSDMYNNLNVSNEFNLGRLYEKDGKNWQDWSSYYGDDVGTFYKYKTYDELMYSMKLLISENNYDVIIHSAAVSDYRPIDVMVGSGTLGLNSV